MNQSSFDSGLKKLFPAPLRQFANFAFEMSLYYSPTQPTRQSHRSFGNNTEPGSTFRLTCVNVNHVTYNYLMENESPSSDRQQEDSTGYCYANGCGVSLPCYQSLASTLQQPHDDTGGGGGFSPFSLPSSCDSPMSLPASSPITNQPFLGIQNNNGHYHQQLVMPGNLFQNEPQTSNQIPLNHGFDMEVEFSLDLPHDASSDDGRLLKMLSFKL